MPWCSGHVLGLVRIVGAGKNGDLVGRRRALGCIAPRDALDAEDGVGTEEELGLIGYVRLVEIIYLQAFKTGKVNGKVRI